MLPKSGVVTAFPNKIDQKENVTPGSYLDMMKSLPVNKRNILMKN